MKGINLKECLKDKNLKGTSEKLYKGACVKIKNSEKTFQVIGINPKNKICWVREWPFPSETNETFALNMNEIIVKSFCASQFSK